MKRATRLTAAAVAAASVMLAACGGGGGNGSAMSPPPTVPSPPPPPAATDFTTFMRGQAAASPSETVEPVEIETMQWTFTDGDNETVYADVLATSM